jgi:hypothetical protein
LHAVVRKSAVIYDQIPLREHITAETRDDLARQLFLDIHGICNAADPIVACRDKLAKTMLQFASYQVLVIPPVPENDPSGLRGQPGITGELKARLVQVVQKNDNLRTEMYEATESRSHDVLWEVLQRSYWQSFWFLQSFDAARIELNDVEKGHDWFKSFTHAACANQEHVYRWELDMPPAFAEDVAKTASFAYALFTDIVLSGDENPGAEWRDYHKDCDIPTPTFDLETA